MKKIVFLLVIAALFGACVQTPTAPGTTAGNTAPRKDGKIRIGFSMDTLKEHWVKDKELIEKRARERGYDRLVLSDDSTFWFRIFTRSPSMS